MARQRPGRLVSWGCNVSGAIGRGQLGGFDAVPAPVAAVAEPVIACAAGWGHSACVTARGDALVFGRAIDARNALRYGRLSMTSPWLAKTVTLRLGGWRSIDFATPSLALSGAQSVKASFALTMIEKDQGLYAMGLNRYGQTGSGRKEAELFHPAKVRVDAKVVKYAVGLQHCLAVDSENRMWAWGNSARGQTGSLQSTSQPESLPEVVVEHVSDVGCGLGHSACLMQDGSVLIWGKRQGPGGADVSQPTPIGMTGRALWCGQHHTVVLDDSESELWQVGQTPEQPTVTKTGQVSGLPTGCRIQHVAAGWGGESMAVLSDGSLWRWDWELQAQPKPELTRVLTVALGWRHALAIVEQD